MTHVAAAGPEVLASGPMLLENSRTVGFPLADDSGWRRIFFLHDGVDVIDPHMERDQAPLAVVAGSDDLVPQGLPISQVVHLKGRLGRERFREGGQGWPWRESSFVTVDAAASVSGEVCPVGGEGEEVNQGAQVPRRSHGGLGG